MIILVSSSEQARTIARLFHATKWNGFWSISACDIFPSGARLFPIGSLPVYHPKDQSGLPVFNRIDVKESQRLLVENLIESVEGELVLLATDPTIEGEYQGRCVLKLTNPKDVKRVLLTDLSRETINHSFTSPIHLSKTDHWWEEAKARVVADLLFLTRFDSGPIHRLALPLLTHMEEQKDDTYYLVYGHGTIEHELISLQWCNGEVVRIFDKYKADQLRDICQEKDFKVLLCEPSPIDVYSLYTLSSLQTDALDDYGLLPHETIEVLMSLYHKGFITYPITHVTSIKEKTVEKIINGLTWSRYEFPMRKHGLLEEEEWMEAIVPLGNEPSELKEMEEKLFDLILKRTSEWFKQKQQYELLAGVDERFGFRTQTNRYYSPNTKGYLSDIIIEVVSSPLKRVRNWWFEITRMNNFGTMNERSQIFKWLIEHNFIEVIDDQLTLSESGRSLLEDMKPKMFDLPDTLKWEQMIRRVRDGDISASEFLELCRKKITVPVTKAVTDGVGTCPKCQQIVYEQKYKYECAGCSFSINKKIKGVYISTEDVSSILSGKKSRLIKGFKFEDREGDYHLAWRNNQLHFLPPDTSHLQIPIQLLEVSRRYHYSKKDDEKLQLLESETKNIKLSAKVKRVVRGPRIRRYELQPEKGIKLNRYRQYKDNFQALLKAESIVMSIPVPGKSVIGIEVPENPPRKVYLREMMEQTVYLYGKPLTIPIGMTVEGKPFFYSLIEMVHLLVAGATGAGKSVFLNSLIISIISKHSPETVRLSMIDPKRVELLPYAELPHLLHPVVTDTKKANTVLKKIVAEMERRYDLLAGAGKRNLEAYNEDAQDPLPYIVLIIDELADLVLFGDSDVEDILVQLAQKSRAAGIHLIIATQRPTKAVISPTMKANLPTRVAFSVSQYQDSMTIIDESGAENLLGKGDMFFMTNEIPRTRLQSPFLSDAEIQKVVQYISNKEE